MQLLLDLPDEIVSQLQTVEDKNEFVSQAVLAAFLLRRSRNLKSVAVSGKPLGHISNLLALLDSPEFNAIPLGDPVEIEKIIQANRNDWDGK